MAGHLTSRTNTKPFEAKVFNNWGWGQSSKTDPSNPATPIRKINYNYFIFQRLEMIMRRTRQPEGGNDTAKPKTDESSSPVGTPSPQQTPSTQSPSTGRSPTVQSPVGGVSPLTATTPERSLSPAVAALLNRRY